MSFYINLLTFRLCRTVVKEGLLAGFAQRPVYDTVCVVLKSPASPVYASVDADISAEKKGLN